MKFTLKDYQDDAVKEVLDRLKKARRRWKEEDDRNAFSLTAATGAGKTVMAAAVFEALFFGNDEYEFEPDPGAVVIWFSDDPSLNVQSRWRLHEASDLLTTDRLVEVGTSFNRGKLTAGTVYFLNTQKLSKNSLLVRGHDPDDAAGDGTLGQGVMPDMRTHTIWDTIQNTIEDPALTLYLVLDEAHRGMNASTKNGSEARPTIVRQLINGTDTVPGIPIVWGISATVQRFNEAIAGMQGHSTMPGVVVDSKKVQESGLLKDTINLDVPDDTGEFSTVLLRRGTDKLRDISIAWAEYTKAQSDGRNVFPLMVLQIPNSPDHKEVGRWLDTIFERWPDLPHDCVANVFGEHKTELFGSRLVPYVEPERVQESDWIRILVAKDAISTGWDCPRAEVMVSFRAATDETHITQLLGRMVRTPLARRIQGNDKLNAVDCLLPHFDKKSVTRVVMALMNGGDSGEPMPGRRVLINPREMRPNPQIPDDVWESYSSLPSQTLPKRQARPVKRLTALAHELALDGLLPDGGKKAHSTLHTVLDGIRAQYEKEITLSLASILAVQGKTVSADVQTKEMSLNDFVEAADLTVTEDAFKRAARVISPALAMSYSEHLAAKSAEPESEDALVAAHTIVAAMGLVPDTKTDLDAAAERLATQWLTQYRISIKGLPDERQDSYRQLREMSAAPLDVDLARPTLWLQQTTMRQADGIETEIPRYGRHLMSDVDGMFPTDLNTWEREVLQAELNRTETVAWYRNPNRSTQESLGIIYQHGVATEIVRPDFLFFSRVSGGKVVADIVDPHGLHLSDALPKLRGLAAYAKANWHLVRRVEAVALVKETYRVLDLTEDAVRQAIQVASSAKDLYSSDVAADFVV